MGQASEHAEPGRTGTSGVRGRFDAEHKRGEWGRRKSGGPSAALPSRLGVNRVNEDECELSKDRIVQKVMAVKDNYVVIRMGVAN